MPLPMPPHAPVPPHAPTPGAPAGAKPPKPFDRAAALAKAAALRGNRAPMAPGLPGALPGRGL